MAVHPTKELANGPAIRTRGAANAAAYRLHGASREEVCVLLDDGPCSAPPRSEPERRYYGLDEECGWPHIMGFELPACYLVIALKEGRVSAAWLTDADAAPGSIARCLQGDCAVLSQHGE